MYDNPLIINIIAAINAGLISMALNPDAPATPNILTISQDQYTQQGAPSQPVILISKIGDNRYGFLGREDKWDRATSKMIHTETQAYETMFQINGLSIQNPANQTQYTAADLVNIAAAIMNSDQTNFGLRELGIGILRITQIRNPYFKDDKGRFEADPSFDFTVEHDQVIISTTPVISEVVINIDRV